MPTNPCPSQALSPPICQMGSVTPSPSSSLRPIELKVLWKERLGDFTIQMKIVIGPRSRGREKQQKGGVSAQGSALSPWRKTSRNGAGRTAPTGRREVGLGPSSARNWPLTPGLSFLTHTRGKHSPCLAPSRVLSAASESRCGRALRTGKRRVHTPANYRPGTRPSWALGVEGVNVANKNTEAQGVPQAPSDP